MSIGVMASYIMRSGILATFKTGSLIEILSLSIGEKGEAASLPLNATVTQVIPMLSW